jgi:hypothetical protein
MQVAGVQTYPERTIFTVGIRGASVVLEADLAVEV